ncbi:MAG: hypothetical protein JSR60_07815 [Proteobacteria bacterium]|nr:hypothetical protein [Pseudomonadota bacterium]
MNTISTMHPKLVSLAAALLLASSNGAWASADNFKFEACAHLSGDSVAVRLIDGATGQAVTDAKVFAVHRQWLPGKGEPRFLERRVALTPDGKGGFTYEGSDVQPGVKIKLIAQAGTSEVAGTTCVCA